MFHNFGAVFRFTLKNQLTKSLKIFVIVIALLLLLTPGVIMELVTGGFSFGEEEEEVAFTVDTIYTVDCYQPEADFNVLNAIKADEPFTKLKYITEPDVETALLDAKTALSSGKNPLVLLIYENIDNIGNVDMNELTADLIIPEGSNVSEEEADQYYTFISDFDSLFTITATGLKMTDLSKLSSTVSYEVYTEEGYERGEDVFTDDAAAAENAADSVLQMFQMIANYLMLMLIYFMILMYGNGLCQNLVIEKENKLMDTMLVSVKPEAMVMGKMLAVAVTSIGQLLIWMFSLIIGLVGGNYVLKLSGIETTISLSALLDNMASYGIFTAPGIIIAVIAIIAAFFFYYALVGIAGAMSNSQEEVSANSFIYTFVILISFFVCMFGGALSGNIPQWMFFVPPIAALLLPGSILTGAVGMGVGLISMGLLIIFAVFFVIIAGRCYKMLSLYKGESLKLGKVIKMLVSGK